MTDTAPCHGPYDELAAGYALHALDPEDQQQFLVHLADCARCQAAVGDYTEVTAALSESRSVMDPSPLLGQRIMAAIADEPQRPSRPRSPAVSSADGPAGADGAGADGAGPEPSAVGDLATQRSRHRRPRPRSRTAALAGAAAAVVLAAGGIWGGLAASGRGSTPGSTVSSVAGCAQPHACRQVLLTSATSQASARVVVKGDTVWLIPSSLPADNATEQVYVLWQITGARKSVPVGSFDVRVHRGAAVWIGTLDVAYRATRAFAVSLEPGRKIPAKPSHTVALGQVAS